MHTAAARLLASLTSRARRTLFAKGCSEGVLATSLALAAGLLGLRFFDQWFVPELTWLWLLAVPVAVGVWRASRLGLSTEQAAAYLDRRLQLGGLLMTAASLPAANWDAALTARLIGAERRLPRLHGRGFLVRAAAPLAVLALVLCLPPPPPPPLPRNPIVAQALTDLREDLTELQKEQALSDTQAKDLEARLQKLEDAHREGQALTWSDLDHLAAELERSKSEQQAELGRTRDALLAAAAGQTTSREALLAQLDKAQQAGLLRTLPQELLDQLGMQPGKTLDPGKALDPALAKALAEALDERMRALEGKLEADSALAEDLARLAEGLGKATMPAHEHTEGCADGH